VETVNKFKISFLPFLEDCDHLIPCRTEAIQCFAIVLTKQMPNEMLSSFIKELDFFVEKENEVNYFFCLLLKNYIIIGNVI
jgi:hypothetical protein